MILAADLAAQSARQATAQETREQRVERSPQFRDGKFRNTLRTGQIEGGMGKAWEWVSSDAERVPTTALPLLRPEPGQLAVRGDDRLRVTWMGHSSLLIEIDGHLLLTDPVWGPRASPVSWAGPARFHAPPLPVEALPELDAIVLSHDHYDHLDASTIKRLIPRTTRFFVPLGVGAHLEKWGVPAARIVELDWWEEVTVGKLRLVSTPARHFSGRGVLDRDETLWTSWAFIGPKHRAWFSGDTGPYAAFDEVGARLGPFDLTMIESGAWDAAWGTVHLGPAGALEVHQQVRGKVLMPVHWGTFNLALHAWDAPIVTLQKLAAAAGITLAAPVAGGTVDPERPEVATAWRQRAGLEPLGQAKGLPRGALPTQQVGATPRAGSPAPTTSRAP